MAEQDKDGRIYGRAQQLIRDPEQPFHYIIPDKPRLGRVNPNTHWYCDFCQIWHVLHSNGGRQHVYCPSFGMHVYTADALRPHRCTNMQ